MGRIWRSGKYMAIRSQMASAVSYHGNYRTGALGRRHRTCRCIWAPTVTIAGYPHHSHPRLPLSLARTFFLGLLTRTPTLFSCTTLVLKKHSYSLLTVPVFYPSTEFSQSRTAQLIVQLITLRVPKEHFVATKPSSHFFKFCDL